MLGCTANRGGGGGGSKSDIYGISVRNNVIFRVLAQGNQLIIGKYEMCLKDESK